MRDHAHVRAEINGRQFICDISGDGESLAVMLAEIMKQLDARGYADVVRVGIAKFIDYLPE